MARGDARMERGGAGDARMERDGAGQREDGTPWRGAT